MSEPTPKFSRYRKDGFVMPYQPAHDSKYYDFIYDDVAKQPANFLGEPPDPELVNVTAKPRKSRKADPAPDADDETLSVE
jgi:hypothetical protein